jgi:hypothetical protein
VVAGILHFAKGLHRAGAENRAKIEAVRRNSRDLARLHLGALPASYQPPGVGQLDRRMKHAVEGFTKAMAIERALHRIRVNTLGPS